MNRFRNDDGLTLTELLVAMIVTIVVLLIGTMISVTTLKQSRFSRAKTNSASSGRIAMEAMSRDLRVAWSPSPNVSPVVVAGPNVIQLWVSKYYGTATLPNVPTPTLVTYWVDPAKNCLMRLQQDQALTTLDGGARCVVSGVFDTSNSSKPIFTYRTPLKCPTAQQSCVESKLDASVRTVTLPMITTTSVATNDLLNLGSIDIQLSVKDPNIGPEVPPTVLNERITLENIKLGAN